MFPDVCVSRVCVLLKYACVRTRSTSKCRETLEEAAEKASDSAQVISGISHNDSHHTRDGTPLLFIATV